MAPEALPDDVARLRARLAELEAEVERYRRGQRTSEERFRSLADAAPVMILMSDTNALCTYFNRAWLEFRGRTLEEELGNGWTEGLHPDDRDLCVESYLKSFSSRSPFRMQYRLQKAGWGIRLGGGGGRSAPQRQRRVRRLDGLGHRHQRPQARLLHPRRG